MKAINCIYSVNINPPSIIPSSPFLRGTQIKRSRVSPKFNNALSMKRVSGIKRVCVVSGLLPVDPWAPNVDSQSIASQLFAFSLFPYLGFLYFITKSKSVPKLTLFGFYFLLAFVGATIPAGIYAKVHYGTSLSNVDWLHGSAESLLTLSNLFVVLGLRKALKEPRNAEENTSEPVSGLGKENPSR